VHLGAFGVLKNCIFNTCSSSVLESKDNLVSLEKQTNTATTTTSTMRIATVLALFALSFYFVT